MCDINFVLTSGLTVWKYPTGGPGGGKPPGFLDQRSKACASAMPSAWGRVQVVVMVMN